MKKLTIGHIVFILGTVFILYGAYIPVKAKVAQYLIHQSWNESRFSGKDVKPWDWADMHPVMQLSFAKYQQELIVLEGDTGNVLAFGPGHNLQSGLPGQDKTIMISGHRDTHFEFLKDVVIGDQFEVNLREASQPFKYQIENIKIINSDTQDIEINEKGNKIKLITCYPFDSAVSGGPLRYVLTAKKVNK
jgi:sortase A